MSDLRGLVRLDVNGLIDEDVVCAHCDYNLRTLPLDTACPECGTAVRDTVRLTWLRGRDAKWLRRIAQGALWAMVAVGCFAIVEAWFAADLLRGSLGSESLIILSALCIGIVVGGIAFWRLTSPDPQQRSTVRRVARVGLCGGLCGLFALLLAANVWYADPYLLVAMALIFLAGGAMAMLIYAAQLARRVPDRRLSQQCRIVAIGYVIGLGGLSAMAVMIERAGSNTFPIEQVVGVLFLLLMVCSLWSLPLLWWYRKRFVEAARLARQRESAR